MGQVVISCMGGFAFAFYDFPGKRLLFGLLVPLYAGPPAGDAVCQTTCCWTLLGVLNTYWALLLPLAFAPLGTFLLTQIFRSVPVDILHAARLDGAGTFHVLGQSPACPAAKGGGATLIVLTLIESWNMVEQPLDLSAGRGFLSLVCIPGKPVHGESAVPICV